ncbi:MAG TPA: NAD(P)H-binding protein [Pyrinomonadaceae bacterium]|nr:NAD(P)H-binding protein [Pyrinomonadaceae bacterium]
MMRLTVFITGGTGFMGRRLITELLRRGHKVRALARRGSESRLPEGCEVVIGDPLDRKTFTGEVAPADTFVQLVGVAHPSPAKAKEFRSVDLQSAREGVAAAVEAGVEHFVYVSVAQPAPIMRAYLEARAEAEASIRASGIRGATILRPWYVLGPGRQWPRLLRPVYWIMERLPSKRETALRLGLLTDEEMTSALVGAVEGGADAIRILNVPEIREAAAGLGRAS